MEQTSPSRMYHLALGMLAALAVLPTFSYAADPKLADSAEPTAEKPLLELEVHGPKDAHVGDEVNFEIVVTNQGIVSATKLVVTDRFEPGLRHARSTAQVERDLDELGPGRSQRIDITLRVTQPGTLAHTVEILSESRRLASTRVTLTAVTPADSPRPAPGQRSPAGGVAKDSAQPDAKMPSAKPGSTAVGEDSAKTPSAEPEKGPPVELGPPLVDALDKLTPMDPQQPLWIDSQNKRVILLAAVRQREGPLELLACLKDAKEAQAILAVGVKASAVHVALLAVGCEPGAPAQLQPAFQPARGTEIDVTLVWKDAKGQPATTRGQEWIRDRKTGKALEQPWVFGGSRFVETGEASRKLYQADCEGTLICVANSAAAVLDLILASPAKDESLRFEAYTERIPPRGTPITLILTPKPKAPAKTP